MLLYVWLERINEEMLGTGITFMKRFHIEYLPSEHTLMIEENKKFIQHFFGKNIEDVTALVGENGAGKTLFSKSLLNMLEKSSAGKSNIVITMMGAAIYVQCSSNQIHTIKFSQKQFQFQDKEQELIDGYTVIMEEGTFDCPVVPFMVTNAFAPAELNDASYLSAKWYRSPVYSLQNVNQWEQERYGIQVGQFLHNNASVFAGAKLNFPLDEYRIYQNRLIIMNYLEGKGIPIFQKMKIYQTFIIGIRLFEGKILMENVDPDLKKECSAIKDMFGNLEKKRWGILESALMMLLEEACLYFPEIRGKIKEKISEWENTNNCMIDTQFCEQLLKCMKESYYGKRSDKWEWLEQAEKLFIQLGEWKEDPDKKDLFGYRKGEYQFGSKEGDRLLEFYSKIIQTDDRFWKRAIGFTIKSGSSGELAAINLFAYITELMHLLLDKKSKQSTFFIIIDEIDVGLHPKWQRGILQYLTEFLGQRFPAQHFQLLITSHSPIILSDIPADRVYLLRKRDAGGVGTIQIEACKNATFGANIYNLFYDGFFMDKGTIGAFAQDKIDAVISCLQGDCEKNSVRMKWIVS